MNNKIIIFNINTTFIGAISYLWEASKEAINDIFPKNVIYQKYKISLLLTLLLSSTIFQSFGKFDISPRNVIFEESQTKHVIFPKNDMFEEGEGAEMTFLEEMSFLGKAKYVISYQRQKQNTMSNNIYLANLIPNAYYHIYNRSNNKEPLFKSDENRLYFLQKYKSYLAPFCHTFAYCLLNNHFHFLIQIKSEAEILETLQSFPKAELSKYQKEFLKGWDEAKAKNDISRRNVIFEERKAEARNDIFPKNVISEDGAKNEISQRNVIFPPTPQSFHQLLAKQFRRFFIAYAKAFNKQHNREGNLFNRPFKRVRGFNY